MFILLFSVKKCKFEFEKNSNIQIQKDRDATLFNLQSSKSIIQLLEISKRIAKTIII